MAQSPSCIAFLPAYKSPESSSPVVSSRAGWPVRILGRVYLSRMLEFSYTIINRPCERIFQSPARCDGAPAARQADQGGQAQGQDRLHHLQVRGLAAGTHVRWFLSLTNCVPRRIRRIKCDEAKPHCERCTSTGRRCDGYAVPEDNSVPLPGAQALSLAAVPPAPWNRLLNYPGTPLEHRYLVFFQRQTAPILSGYFDSSFWNGLLLQVGRSEPTIQHAMMAVASIHEQVEGAGIEFSGPSQWSRDMDYGRCFALQQYNRAIACLKERLSEGPQPEEVTLMCCVLFICLEFLRGNIDTAMSHLHSGLEILAGWQARNRRLSRGASLPISSEPQSLPQNLAEIFSRLTIQSMLCGRVPPPVARAEQAGADLSTLTPAVFPSLKAARTSLDLLMKISLQFLREARERSSAELSSADKQRLSQLASTCDRWSLAFDLFLVGSSATRTLKEVRAATILRILNIVARVWLSSTASAGESVFDTQTDALSAIVNLAAMMSPDHSAAADLSRRTCTRSPTAENPHNFTFEMGVIPPLYFVATKCRVPSIRRAAISLLETTTPRREGIWIASLYAAVARRIVQIEEQDLDVLGFKIAGAEECVPPEWMRVRDALIHTRGEENLTERVQKVTFMRTPHGVGGAWAERDEEILW